MRKLILALLLTVALAACTSIDCPMNSLVTANYGFYSVDGEAVNIINPLTISTNRRDGNDTVLINQMTNAHSIRLPMSHQLDTDTLLFSIIDEDSVQTTDYVYVKKTNDMHFESVDCGPSFFHQIISVSSTHNFIDTVTIVKKDVNYDPSQEHIQIFVY